MFKSNLEATEEIRNSLDQPKLWTIRTHQNAGWHYSLVFAGLSLHESNYGNGSTFWTLLTRDEKYQGCGDPDLSTHKSFSNPNDAVDHQMDVAEEILKAQIASTTKMLAAFGR